ncbi:MAG: pyridoxamine 5'-phosphate oxidase family protein [Sedimentisphaerales bacterium]|nr:pyridoxamine 5'-phosphate oxidase family protein [Sedimentisphaerales bacterium]
MIIPNDAKELMEQKKVIALATASKEAIPNVVYMLQYWWYQPDILVIGDVFMNASRKNVQENGYASFCIWDEETDKSYKFTGTAKYEASGKAYEFANENLHKKKPDKNFKGVIVIKVTQVYDACRNENAGKLIASE